MLLLMLFAVVAGAGTAITPCVLPVLPALLSASALGGKRRPLGIVIGLGATFTITIVALAQLVGKVGVGGGAARTLAVCVLIGFGLVMLVPELAARVEAPLSRLARFGPKSRGDGFRSGLAVGAALGFVCTPCAGPILGAVIFVGNYSGPTLRAVIIALCYSAGLAAVMLLWAFAGRALIARARRAIKGDVVQRVLGGVLIATGLAIAFNLDVSLENRIAGLPSFLQDPATSLETSGAIRNELAALRNEPSPFSHARAVFVAQAPGVGIPGVQTPSLPRYGAAPPFTDTQQWFNTPGGRPLTLAQLRGHVVLVDFWTYTCINCIRTLPFVEGLYRNYHRYGLEVVGVETPEFTFEQEASNVLQAIHSDGLTYPVVQDNRYGTWNAYGNQYWPAEYLIDATGYVRHYQFGEGNYKQDEAAVRALLYAAGAHRLPPPMTAHAVIPSTNVATPETYLDFQRAQGFVQPLRPGAGVYSAPAGTLALDQFALQGSWDVGSQSITPLASGASIEGGVQARDVYLVMTSAGNVPRRVRVLLNGKPIAPTDAGTDVRAGGYVTVSSQRLYGLVKLPTDEGVVVKIQIPPGVSAYDFTFG